jgi:hypothetical protein
MFYEVLSIFKNNVFLTFDLWPWHTQTLPQTIFFHMTLLSVEGININSRSRKVSLFMWSNHRVISLPPLTDGEPYKVGCGCEGVSVIVGVPGGWSEYSHPPQEIPFTQIMIRHDKIVYGSFLQDKWRRVTMEKYWSLYHLGTVLYG